MFHLQSDIYYEARNESTAGQIAVTQVVFNRVKSTRFPSTSCDVIQQGKHVNGFPVLNRCQFSWYCDGRGDVPHNMKAFEKSQKHVLRGEKNSKTKIGHETPFLMSK